MPCDASIAREAREAWERLKATRRGLDGATVPTDERCRYPSKFCANKRARKTNGHLHRFCELHRRRANLNQKRWTQVRRTQGASSPRTIPLSLEQVSTPLLPIMPTILPMVSLSAKPECLDWTMPAIPVPMVAVASMSANGVMVQDDQLLLNEQDLDLLVNLLVDETPEPKDAPQEPAAVDEWVDLLDDSLMPSHLGALSVYEF